MSTTTNQPHIKRDVGSFFKDNASATFELASEHLSKVHAEEFCNSEKNEAIGTSCASFESVEEATNDIL